MTIRSKSPIRFLGPVLATLLIVGAAGSVLAQDGPGRQQRFGRGEGRHGGGPGQRLERLVAHLDLNEDQIAAVKDLHEQARAANRELRKDLMRLRNEKRGEMLKDDPSTQTVLNLTEKIGELRTEMQSNRMRTKLGVRELLTPEQRDKMLMMGEGRRGPRGAGRAEGRHGKHRPAHREGCGQQDCARH